MEKKTRNKLALAFFNALIIATAVAGAILVRAFVEALWGPAAGCIFAAVAMVLCFWWLFYSQYDEEDKEDKGAKEVVIVEDRVTYHTWVKCRGDVFDTYYIMYISRNPNKTINIHFADGKVMNTMIDDYDEFCEKILHYKPTEI